MTHFNYSSQLTNHLRSANCIGSVMVSVLTCMVVDRGFESDRNLMPLSTIFQLYNRGFFLLLEKGRRGRNHMVVRFTTTYTISPYHHYS
jgi:hypothetical protein